MAKYKVNEIFYSIQGEGRHAGRAAIFVRFSGCNLKCPFCDTDFKKYEEMGAIDILNKIQLLSPDCKFVVFTGGEPTLQVDEELTTLLQNWGYYIAVETNGTHLLPQGIDWITCSPKKAFVETQAAVVIPHANELKLVFDDKHPVDCCHLKADYLYLQPCDTGNDEQNAIIMKHCIEYTKQHPEWQLSLQTHKIIGIQ